MHLALAQELTHPFSLAFAWGNAGTLHRYRREESVVQTYIERVMALAAEHGFVTYEALGLILQGWALVKRERWEEGIARIHQGEAATRALGSGLGRTFRLAILAEVYEKAGWIDEGLAMLAEALAVVNKTGERCWEAELYRLKGELLLMQEAKRQKAKSKS